MQMLSMNNCTNNTNFGAKINLVGGTLVSPKAKNLLPKNSLKRLEEKAKTIGTDKDSVNIGLWRTYEFEPCRNLFLNALGVPTYCVKECKTSLTLTSVFPSKKMVDDLHRTEIRGSIDKQKFSAYKAIWKYLDALGEKYKTK